MITDSTDAYLIALMQPSYSNLNLCTGRRIIAIEPDGGQQSRERIEREAIVSIVIGAAESIHGVCMLAFSSLASTSQP